MINPRFLTSLLLLGAFAGRVSASLPPEAQDLVGQGIQAGKNSDHQQAIEHFRAALALAPDAPEIFLTLGVAESNLPGRELRAMAWFGAYIRVRPTADNSAAVSNQSLKLETRFQANVSHVLTIAEDAAKRFGDPQNFDRVDALRRIVEAQSSVGEIAGAQETAAGIRDSKEQSIALSYIAEAQVKSGDLAAAQETVDNIQDSALKDDPQRLIDLARAANGSTNPWVLIITDQLNDPVFLDLAAYLESLPTDDGKRSFDGLCDAADKMIEARQLLKELLARGTEVSADRSQPE